MEINIKNKCIKINVKQKRKINIKNKQNVEK